jgi:hypothetical protein
LGNAARSPTESWREAAKRPTEAGKRGEAAVRKRRREPRRRRHTSEAVLQRPLDEDAAMEPPAELAIESPSLAQRRASRKACRSADTRLVGQALAHPLSDLARDLCAAGDARRLSSQRRVHHRDEVLLARAAHHLEQGGPALAREAARHLAEAARQEADRGRPGRGMDQRAVEQRARLGVDEARVEHERQRGVAGRDEAGQRDRRGALSKPRLDERLDGRGPGRARRDAGQDRGAGRL